MIRKTWWLPAVLLFLVCSRDDGRITGPSGGSKSPNALVQGTVTCTGCDDAAGAVLTVFSINPDEDGYTWRPVDTTVTDSTGRFAFKDSLESGEYSITVQKDAYKGFSGYFTIIDDDSTVDVDSIVLQPAITLLGAFVMMDREYFHVSILGQPDTAVITPQSSSADRQFVMESLAPGQYIIRIAVDYSLASETEYYIPVDIRYNPAADTTYRDTVGGMATTVEISGTFITIEVEYALKLIFILVEDDVSGTGKRAAVFDTEAYIKEYFPEGLR